VSFTPLSGSEKLVLREVFTSVQGSGPLPGYIHTYVFKALVCIRLLDRKLIMEKGFLDKVEDNAAVQNWSETTQQEKGDSLVEGYVSELCGYFDWVPLLGIWGAIGYALLLVLRQYRSRQFVPTNQELAQCEFSYKCDGYKKKIRKMTNTWRQTRRMKRLDFERRNLKLEKKIEQMEEEKMNLKLDMDVQKLEIESLRKRIRKVEEDLNSLKTDYKRLRLLLKTAGLGKTSEQ
ncbi:hypothetical protein Gotur_027336, partial [Gossypium turneri]